MIPPKRPVQELDKIFRGFDDIVTANSKGEIDMYFVLREK